MHPYEMHRTLMRAFPRVDDAKQSNVRQKFGVLFRTEHSTPTSEVNVFVQSSIEPDWSFLDNLKSYLYIPLVDNSYQCKEITNAINKISDGQILRFRLKANPVKRVGKQDDPLKGKRVELTRHDDQVDWLVRRGRGIDQGKTGGFDILPDVKVCAEEKVSGRKKTELGIHQMTHHTVLFEGKLKVTDKRSFIHTLTQGVGPGKAVGCGLMTVAPFTS
jgi:CRISPR system Cascade subunit CasE